MKQNVVAAIFGLGSFPVTSAGLRSTELPAAIPSKFSDFQAITWHEPWMVVKPKETP